MTFYEKVCFASRAAALALLVIAVGCDRDKESSPPERKAAKPMPSRFEDQEYREQLKKLQSGQRKVARELNDIEKKMEIERKRARAALGANATDAQVLAELEANPVKYPQWKYLAGRRNAAESEMKNQRAKAREEVLERIAREQRERDAAGAAK